MMKFAKKHRFIPLLLAGILTTVPCLFADIFYMYGDDYLLNYIANGSFGEAMSAHLVFISWPVGLLLKAFYALLPAVNWYAVYLFVLLIVSFAVFYDSLLVSGAHPALLLLFMLLNLAAAPLFLTYTVAGFLIAASGLSHVLVRLRAGRPFRALIPGVLLMCLSYLTRRSCLLPVCALAFPLYLSAILHRPGRLLTLAKAGILLLVLLASGRLADRAAYSGEAWQSYMRYNSARSAYLDYPLVPYEQFEAEFRDAGFSKEAYLLLNRWTFCEKDSFSEERLRAVADIIQKAYGKRYRLRYTLDSFTQSPNLWLILIPGACLLLFLLAEPDRRKLPACLTYLMLLLVLGALAFIRLRFLLRVAAPLAIADMALIVLAPRAERPPGQSRAALFLSALFLLVLCGLFLRGYRVAVASLRSKPTAASYGKLRREIDAHPGRIYAVESPIYVHLFAWGHTIDEVRRTDTFSHVIRAGSWDNFSPRYYAIAEAAGVPDPDNLLRSLIESGNMRLVTENESFVLDFLSQETGMDCCAEKINKKGAARIIKVGCTDKS